MKVKSGRTKFTFKSNFKRSFQAQTGPELPELNSFSFHLTVKCAENVQKAFRKRSTKLTTRAVEDAMAKVN